MNDAPPVIPKRPSSTRPLLLIGLAVAALGAALLYLYDPAEHGFYPRCFFRAVTGWDCPGCGGLRATHQLLRGHVGEAFALNPLLVITVPLLIYAGTRSQAELLLRRRLPMPLKSPVWIWLAAIAVLAFGVLRNLPWRQWWS